MATGRFTGTLFEEFKEKQREQPGLHVHRRGGFATSLAGPFKRALGQRQRRLRAAAERCGKAEQRLVIDLNQLVEP